MPSVSRAGGMTQFAGVTYPPPGTVNKGAGVSNGGSTAPTFNILTESGIPITTEAGVRLETESGP